MKRRHGLALPLLALNAPWAGAQTGAQTRAPIAAPTPMARPVRIAYLSPTTLERSLSRRALVEALNEGLRERGLRPGADVVIDVLSADGRNEAYPGLVSRALAGGAQVLVAAGSIAALAARNGVAASTRKVPVIFVSVGNVEHLRLVPSLARPGGWATGRTAVTQQLDPKRIEFLMQLLPGLQRVAVLAMATAGGRLSASYEAALAAMRAAAPRLVIEPIAVRPADALDERLSAVAASRPQALLVFDQSALLQQVRPIVQWAARRRLPLMGQQREWVQAGALMSYGANNLVEYRLLAAPLAKVIEGVPPG